jgi:NAD(P)-dependent dehydrogenase (short-subunit alcohol dehydrogenase family)
LGVVATFVIDISSAESVSTTYSLVKSKFTRIDYAVQCAGIALLLGQPTDSLEQFDKQVAVNYRGLWLCTRETFKIMANQELDSEAYPDAKIMPTRAQRGSVVNLASNLAQYAQPQSAAYIGSKGAVCALTRADAMDYASRRIRVNAVLPGITDSPMTNPSPEVRAWLEEVPVQRVPFKRFGLPEEIADVSVFLAGNGASLVNGVNLAVDGGLVAGFN